MIKKIGLLLAGAMSIYALEACIIVGVDCTQNPTDPSCTDNSGGAGGAGGNDTVSSSSSSSSGTAGAGGGTAGAGGAPACVGCAEGATKVAGGGTLNKGELCAASQPIYDQFTACICDAVKCLPECGDSAYCKGGGAAATQACNDCAAAQCKDLQTACINDI